MGAATRWLIALALVTAGCASVSPPPPPASLAPAPPSPVAIIVRTTSPRMHPLLPAILEQARARLTALGHEESAQARLVVELEVHEPTRTLEYNGAVNTCVSLVGRVVRDGQRFASVDVRRQDCTGDRMPCPVLGVCNDHITFAPLALLTLPVDTARLAVEMARPVTAQEVRFRALDELVTRLSMAARAPADDASAR